MCTRTAAALSTVLLLAACAGQAERVSYEIADSHASWLDRFHADARACARAGGVIVRERHAPDPIRLGHSRPNERTRYWCLR